MAGLAQAIFVIPPRLCHPAGVQQGDGAVDPDLRVLRSTGDGFVVGGDRSLETALDFQQHAEIGPAHRRTRVEGNSALKMINRIRNVPNLSAQQPERMVGGSIARRPGQPGLIMRDGLGRATDSRQQFAKITARVGVIGTRLCRAVQQRHRPRHLALSTESKAENQLGLRVTTDGEQQAGCLLGSRKAPLLQVGNSAAKQLDTIGQ